MGTGIYTGAKISVDMRLHDWGQSTCPVDPTEKPMYSLAYAACLRMLCSLGEIAQKVEVIKVRFDRRQVTPRTSTVFPTFTIIWVAPNERKLEVIVKVDYTSHPLTEHYLAEILLADMRANIRYILRENKQTQEELQKIHDSIPSHS